MRLVEIASRVGNDRSLSRMMKGRREREREREREEEIYGSERFVCRQMHGSFPLSRAFVSRLSVLCV